MKKGEISGRFNTLRNRGEGNDKGIYWVSRRMGKIRNILIVLGFGFCFIYGYFWFKKNGHKLKSPCERALDMEFNGVVTKAFMEQNSKGVVTVNLLNGTDTLEYNTGWGGHTETGKHIRTGYVLEKKAGSFDLKVIFEGRDTVLTAGEKGCE